MKTVRIQLKLSVRHPLVKHILAVRESGHYCSLTVQTIAGDSHIVDPEDWKIIDGTPSFRSRQEALNFIQRARDIAFRVSNGERKHR